MGRSYTPRYGVNFGNAIDAHTGARLRITAMSWRVASMGKPTLANLTRWVERQDDLNIGSVEIIDQRNGAVVARYVAPMFRVVGGSDRVRHPANRATRRTISSERRRRIAAARHQPRRKDGAFKR